MGINSGFKGLIEPSGSPNHWVL